MFRERHHASIMEFENFRSVKDQQPAQDARLDQGVHLGVHILDSIRQHDRDSARGCRGPTGVEQHGHTGGRCERVGDSPCQDASREVVDHGMEIGAGPIEQADDSRVDVVRSKL